MRSGGERVKKKTLFFVFFLRNEEEDRGDQQSQVNCNFEPTFYQFEIKPLTCEFITLDFLFVHLFSIIINSM